MKRTFDRLGILASALLLIGGGAGATLADETEPRTVTANKPAAFQIEPATSDEGAAAHERGYIEISVVGYEPARDGLVQIVVQLEGAPGEAVAGEGDESIDLGRFAIFPDAPFDRDAPEKSQFFGFALPENFATPTELGNVRVRVSIESIDAAIDDARVELGEVRLTTR